MQRLLTLIFLFITCFSQAQVQIKVMDSKTQIPLENVRVRAEDGQTQLSNTSGILAFSGSEIQNFTFFKSGYEIYSGKFGEGEHLVQLVEKSLNLSEITVTAGATQAILTALLAVVHPGDEVIVLEPCYDSYVPNIELAGGVVVRVPLKPGTFRPDFDKIGAAITTKTRAIIVNSPHNPSATVWTEADMRSLQDLLAPTDVLLISDEVYEHMVFDADKGRRHQSAALFAGLAARTFIVSSFGKTYHVTGWKVGFVAAPAALTVEFRKVHQFNVFTVNTPVQHALAAYMGSAAPYLDLPAFYQRKRDLFRAGLAGSRFRLLPSEGSYFQCVDISEVSDLGEAEFCKWLTTEIGVAAIPLSAFYGSGFDQRVVRFCFAKKDATLHAALERLAML